MQAGRPARPLLAKGRRARKWASRLRATQTVVAPLKSVQVSADSFSRGGGIPLFQRLEDFLVLLTGKLHIVPRKQAFLDQFLQGAADVTEQFGQDFVLTAGGNRKMELQV